MRIGLVAGPWLPVPPPAYGGTEGVIDRLATGLLAAGHDVLLFTTGDSTCPVPRAWARERAAPERLGESFVELHHLVHAYDTVQDCDIVHDHTILGPAYARCRPGVLVTTNHGPFLRELNDIYERAARHAAIVAISHDQASRATMPVAAVIHHGLGPDAFVAGAGDGGYLLFLGRFHPDKGAHEAVRLAREAGVPLLLAAKMREPAEVAYFEQHVEPLLGDGIEYVGEVGPADKLALLGGARALLNPIRWAEPFGLVMIEALACGTPVLASPMGAAPEIVDDGRTGYLCETREEFLAAIAKVGGLDRDACRRDAALRFSADRMVAQHVALYERLLAATR
jgi:glycosyltransferase involved in cell wall biosynthesis